MNRFALSFFIDSILQPWPRPVTQFSMLNKFGLERWIGYNNIDEPVVLSEAQALVTLVRRYLGGLDHFTPLECRYLLDIKCRRSFWRANIFETSTYQGLQAL